MKVKLIIISIILLLLMVFACGCIFLEKMSSITSPSLEVDRSGDGEVNYWAVIVGIENYKSITNLSYTVDDADDMRDVLVFYGNWDMGNIQLLTDGNASKSNIQSAITNNMARSADADDVCLFFFSGHGSRIPDEDGDEGKKDRYDEVICPYDTTAEIGNVISDDELGDWLSACPGKVVVILDTCMSGGFLKGVEGKIKTVPNPRVPKDAIAKKHFGEDLVERLKQRPISRDLSQAGYVVLMACGERDYAYEYEALENGVFTYYVAEALSGPADVNSNNEVSAEESFDYADPLVFKYYRPAHQRPELWDGYGGELPLVVASIPGAGVIAGKVTDTDSTTIEGATVVVEGTSLPEATTDENGDYTINNVPVGNYTVTASATGYIKDSQLADVSEGGTTVVDFTLTPETTPSNTMHVFSIEMSLKIAGKKVNAIATVTIFDASNNFVEGATVYGHWSDATSDIDSGVTDTYGKVSLKSDKAKKPKNGEIIFTFTVDDVAKAGWTYVSEGYVTSESITVP